MASTAKTLRPPFKWLGSPTNELVEDGNLKRWTIDQVRQMKNGTYDWKNHEERRV